MVELSNCKDVICADFDQQRKELIICLSNGFVLSLSIRPFYTSKKGVPKIVEKTNITDKDVNLVLDNNEFLPRSNCFQAISRVSKLLYPKNNHFVINVQTQDVTETSLLLSDNGQIVCLETATLDALWFIPRSAFLYQPNRIWVDKFGSDFIVYTSSGTNVMVEYWSPPKSFQACEISQFERVVLPIKEVVLSVCIEYLSKTLGVCIVIITGNRLVHLYRVNDTRCNFSLTLDCTLKLNGDIGSFNNNINKGNSLVTITSFLSLKSDPLSGCPVTIIVSRGIDVCVLALHTKSKDDELLTMKIHSIENKLTQIPYNNIVEEHSLSRPLNTRGRRDNLIDRFLQRDSHIKSLMTKLVPEGKSELEIIDNDDETPSLDTSLSAQNSISSIEQDVYFALNESRKRITVSDVLPESLLVFDDSRPSTSQFSPRLIENSAMITKASSDQQNHIEVGNNTPCADTLKSSVAEDRNKNVDVKDSSIQIVSSGASHGSEDTTILIKFPIVSRLDTTISDHELNIAENVMVTSSSEVSLHNSTHKDSNKTSVLQFTPLNMISGFEDDASNTEVKSKSELLKIISPPSIMMMTILNRVDKDVMDESAIISSRVERKKTYDYAHNIQLFTRKGFSDFYAKSEDLSSILLDFSMTSIAYRTSLLCLITKFKEGFIFDLKADKSGEYAPPLRLELNVKPQAIITCIHSCDVSFHLPTEKLGPMNRKVESMPIIGTYIVCFFGDSYGCLNYSLCQRGSVLQSGCLDRIHNMDIVAILSTGDANKPIWRVGSEYSNSGAKGQSVVAKPIAIAGSPIVTVSKVGEIKVWQPIFSAESKVRSKKEHMLHVYGLDWKMSGTFFVKPSKQIDGSQYVLVSKACLDPTCTILIISFTDGHIEQWPIPGLLNANSGALATTFNCIYSTRHHSNGITDSRLYIHANDTQVNEIDLCADILPAPSNGSNQTVLKEKESEQVYASIIKSAASVGNDNYSAPISKKRAIAYTIRDLRRLASISSLTTSSSDNTILIWKFDVNSFRNQVQNPSESNVTCYLQIHPCQRYSFSSPPLSGLCYNPNYPKTTTEDDDILSLWKVDVIVNGIVITATIGSAKELFMDNVEAIEGHNKFIASEESSIITDDNKFLPVIPVLGKMLRPSQTSQFMTKKIELDDGFGWYLLDKWAALSDTQNFIQLNDNLKIVGSNAPIFNDEESLNDSINTDVLFPVTRVNLIVEELGPGVTKDMVSDINIHDRTRKLYHNGVRLNVPEEKIEYALLQDRDKYKVGDINFDQHPRTLSSGLDKSDDLSIVSDDMLLDRESLASYIPLAEKEILISTELPSLTMTEQTVKPPTNNYDASRNVDVFKTTSTSRRFKKIKITRAAILRAQEMYKRKEIESNFSIGKNKIAVYKSTVTVENKFILNLEENATKQVHGNSSLFTPPLNFYESQVNAAKNKFVLNPQSPAKKKLDTEASVADSELLDSTVNDSTHDSNMLKLDSDHLSMKKGPSLLGIVYDKSVDITGDYESKSNIGGLQNTESFAQVSTYFDRNAKPIIYKQRKPIKKYISRKKKEEDEFSIASSSLASGVSQEHLEDFNMMITTFSAEEKELFGTLDDTQKLNILNAIRLSLESSIAVTDADSVDANTIVDQSVGESSTELDANGLVVKKSTGVTKLRAVLALQKGKGGLLSAILKKQTRTPEFGSTIKSIGLNDITIEIIPRDEGSIICFVLEQPQQREETSTEENNLLSGLVVPREVIPEVSKCLNIDMIKSNYKILSIKQLNKVDENEEVTIVLNQLKPERSYKVYILMECYGDKDGVPYASMSQESFLGNSLSFRTQDEILDLEWGRLSEDMRNEECKAASRSLVVQKEAAKQQPPIILLTDDELSSRVNIPNNSKDKQHRALLQKWDIFRQWWLGEDIYLGISPVRCAFLWNESVFAAKDQIIINQYKSSQVVNDNEVKELVKLMQKVQYDAVDEVGGPLESPLFKHFQSWYKGGQILEDFQEEYSVKLHQRKQDTLDKRSATLNQSVESPDIVDEVKNGALDASEDEQKILDEIVPNFIQIRLESRMEYLKERCKLVDLCKARVYSLVEQFKEGEKKGLTENDLTSRRSDLSMKEVDIIMASKKLVELCTLGGFITKKLDYKLIDSGKIPIQGISQSNVFGVCNTDLMRPDEAPVPFAPCLPGTNRRPLKSWIIMSDDEKKLELCIACTIDTIFELAVLDGVAVPEAEDATLDPKVFSFKHNRWKAFEKWYVGTETKNGPDCFPTLARVIFAEKWEFLCVDTDPEVKQNLRLVTLPQLHSRRKRPQDQMSFGSVASNDSESDEETSISTEIQASSSASIISSFDLVSAVTKPNTTSTVDDDSPPDTPVKAEDCSRKSELVLLYENGINTNAGTQLRFKMLRKSIDAVMTSRRRSMLRILSPPGGSRFVYQYMFPVKLGMLVPTIEMPAKRYKLYPSRTNEAWTTSEILSWYCADQLDEDDIAMEKAEAYAIKRMAYLEWCAHEEERLIECRLALLEEDRLGRNSRDYWNDVERKLNSTELMRGDQFHTHFALAIETDLQPDKYVELHSNRGQYTHGSGVHNEDELEDIVEEQRQAAIKALENEFRIKKEIEDDRNRREAEEIARLKKIELEKRLNEGQQRRETIRSKLEELKKQRQYQIEEQRRKEVKDKEFEDMRLEALAIDLQYNMERKELEKKRLFELGEMYKEEISLKETNIRSHEIMQMEHEDIVSFMREQDDLVAYVQKEKKDKFLKRVLEPFKPFVFKKNRVKLPALNSLLDGPITDTANDIKTYDYEHESTGNVDNLDDVYCSSPNTPSIEDKKVPISAPDFLMNHPIFPDEKDLNFPKLPENLIDRLIKPEIYKRAEDKTNASNSVMPTINDASLESQSNSQISQGLSDVLLVNHKPGNHIEIISRSQNKCNDRVIDDDMHSSNEIKKLFSNSADFVSQLKQKDYFNYSDKKKLATIASLSALSKLDPQDKFFVGPNGVSKKVKRHKSHMKEIIEHNTPLDLITGAPRRDLLESVVEADSNVKQFKEARVKLGNYVSSEAYLQDKYYLMAAEPGIREKTSIESNHVALKFRELLDSQRFYQQLIDSQGQSNRNEVLDSQINLATNDVLTLQLSALNNIDSDSLGEICDSTRHDITSKKDIDNDILSATSSKTDPLDKTRQINLKPPFYSKPLGVKGYVYNIQEIHPLHQKVLEDKGGLKNSKSIIKKSKERTITYVKKQLSKSRSEVFNDSLSKVPSSGNILDHPSYISDLSKDDNSLNSKNISNRSKLLPSVSSFSGISGKEIYIPNNSRSSSKYRIQRVGSPFSAKSIDEIVTSNYNRNVDSLESLSHTESELNNNSDEKNMALNSNSERMIYSADNQIKLRDLDPSNPILVIQQFSRESYQHELHPKTNGESSALLEEDDDATSVSSFFGIKSVNVSVKSKTPRR